ncbi:MAG: diacylglycerol kinase [Helicobacteraceae bacterium]|jgi:diacylglycerol kinase (ATP)|nr:diacylglycerol kinase [Helicobacteraceae bacterium]
MKRVKSSKFNLFRNLINSINGFIEVTKNETPMKAELLLFAAGTILLLLLPMPFAYRAVLFVSLFFPILGELINSAIERTVDLVTLEYHDLAKAAKDAASAVVLVSLALTGVIWAVVLYLVYIGG